MRQPLSGMMGGMKGGGWPQPGILTQWDMHKACGWVQCGTTGTPYFAHKSEFAQQFSDAAPPAVGMPVLFTPGTDAKSGKMRATCIQLVGGPFGGGKAAKVGRFSAPSPYAYQAPMFYPAPMPMQMVTPRVRGRLSEWSAEKACGWVECMDPAQADRRLFAHKSEFAKPWGDDEAAPEGAMLSFVIGMDAKSGKLRCQDIRVEKGGAVAGQSAGGRQIGNLMEWNVEKGCGWIQCQEVPGGKLFAHKTEFRVQFSDGDEPPIGTPLSFVIGLDKKSGKVRACGIQVAAGDVVADGRVNSTIEKWNAEKACGWIESSETGGSPIFAHKSEFLEQFDDSLAPSPGMAVSYVLGVDQKSGKLRATQIQFEQGTKRGAPGGVAAVNAKRAKK